jgi:hypothetical protein
MLASMKTLAGTIILVLAFGIGCKIQAQSASSPEPSASQPAAHNYAAEIVEEEAKALKAPTGCGREMVVERR